MTARAKRHSGQAQLLLPIAGGLPAEPPPLTEADIDGMFAEFYRAYPLKRGSHDARKAFGRIIHEGRATLAQLIEGARAYADECRGRGTEKRWIKYPSGWLNAGRWADEHAAPYSAATASFARIGAEFRAKAGR